ncbi:pyridoxal phosphate-dependent transferase [Melampsora americana]|nr:pyridoxal phosphate-dependent transferase [Melampsora americana]
MSSNSNQSELAPYLNAIYSISTYTLKLIRYLPGSEILLRYIKSSHQNDPFRTLLEILLIFFVIRTWRQSRTRGDVGTGKNFVKLTQKEIDELVSEWKPDPLVDPPLRSTQALSRPPIIIGPPLTKAKIIYGEAAERFIANPENEDSIDPKDIKIVLNLASVNFAGLIGNEQVKRKAIDQLRRSGVGSCGPPGFYGTFDVHMELEQDIARFIGLQSSIIYAQGFSTTSSVIPSFSKRGDIIVVDRGVNFSIQKGIQISRSTIRWYDHNDSNSLEKVLEQLKLEEIKFRRKLSRKFIITEGLFEGDGQLCDLPNIIKLKEKYKFRLILDETWSVGSIGKTGRGLTEYFGVPATSVDILIGSLATSFNSGGGFCAGSNEVVAHQRINSAALVFSAALPPLLASAASETIKILSEEDGEERMKRLRRNISILRNSLSEISTDGTDDQLIKIPSNPDSPMLHLNLKSIDRNSEETHQNLNSSLNETWKSKSNGMTNLISNDLSSFEEQEDLLQTIVDKSIHEKSLLITRTKKVWEQEIDPMLPSIRICLSAELNENEVKDAGEKLVEVIKEVLVKPLI